MRTIVIRVERPAGAGDYTVRAEVLDGQHRLAKHSRKLRVPRHEPVTLDDHCMHALLQGVLDELVHWHSEGLQLPIW